MTNEMKSKIIYKTSKQKTETEFSASVFVIEKAGVMSACFDIPLPESSGSVQRIARVDKV